MGTDAKEMVVSLGVLGISKDELLEKLLQRLQHDAIEEMDDSLNTRFNTALREMIGKSVEAYAKKPIDEWITILINENITFERITILN
jgi:hypothetical protein